MEQVQVLRTLVEQRLRAAVEEIFVLFERTVAEYEEELCRSEQENQRQRKLLEAVLTPQVLLQRTDVQQQQQQRVVRRDEDPSDQQEDPPEAPLVKVEQEETPWTSLGEQLQQPEEAEGRNFTFTCVPVKKEEDEETPQLSQLHESHTEESEEAEPPASSSTQHMGTNTNGEDCGRPGPGSSPGGYVPPDTPSSSSLRNTNPCLHDVNEKLFACSHCGRKFQSKDKLQLHLVCHSGEKPFSCSICSKIFASRYNCRRHMMLHSGEKPFSCSVCEKRFARSDHLSVHMNVHPREKPCICSVCGKRFTSKLSLKNHMCIHTKEKPFSCDVCDKSFFRQSSLRGHMCS